jgi:hypothetical protein
MKPTGEHPEDLTPLLSSAPRDAATEPLRRHVEGCAACRDEIEEGRSLGALLRSADIEVPVGQWLRIEERLRAEREARWSERLARLLGLGTWAYRSATAAVLALVLAVTGVFYQKAAEERQILMKLSGPDDNAGGNPFDAYAAGSMGENPFDRFTTESSSNPFAAPPAPR